MKAIKIKIQIPDADKTIQVNVPIKKKVLEILQPIIESPDLNLPQKNDAGTDLEYALWFGTENIAQDEITFEQSGLVDNDILILKPLLGKTKKRKTGKRWYQKISKQQVLIVTLLIISLFMTGVYFINQMDIFENKIQAKKGEIGKYRDSISNLKQELSAKENSLKKTQKKLEDLKAKNKKLLEERKKLSIYDLDVFFYNRYNRQIGQNNMNIFRASQVKKVKIDFTIAQNPYAFEEYKNFYILLKINGRPITKSEDNVIEADSLQSGEPQPYTFMVYEYYENKLLDIESKRYRLPSDARLVRGTFEVYILNENGDKVAEKIINI